jgi:hypothetical protein
MGNDGKYKDAYQKLFEVYTEVPIKVSNELGFTEDPWLGGVEVSDKFKGKNIDIVTRQNSKGEAVKYARIKTKVPVDVDNEGFRQRYDAENMASKFRQGVDQGVLVEYDDQGRMWNAETKQLIK